MQRAIILSSGPSLSLGDAWLPMLERLPIGESVTLLEIERRHIMNVLKTAGGGSKGRAARRRSSA